MQNIFRNNKKKNFWHLCLAGLLALALTGRGLSATPTVSINASEADLVAIRQTASDYIDG